jgi:hypothetical protein
MDPMTRAWLSSSDAPTSLKITCLKMAMVVVATALDDFGTVQPPLVALLVFAVCFYQLVEVSSWHVAQCIFGSADSAVTVQPPLVALLVFAFCSYQLVEVSRMACSALCVAECWLLLHRCITNGSLLQQSSHAQQILQRDTGLMSAVMLWRL